jgi:GAF domain-containing protein
MPHAHRPSTADAYASFDSILSQSGARAALAYVSSLSDYRFIGIFRFRDTRATSVIHFDREQPEVLQAAEVPETATYCCFVRDSRGSFTTVDALADPRLTDHAARDAVRAYCGIPVIDAEGNLLGTLCHYDVVPRDAEQLDLELLVQVASTLAQGGHVPPYPAANG